ncbi:DUF3617 domain-containing protein [Ideonella sp. BN130291]|uniref:DUF3617 domain-containing protein n=1 Tax=Ideonella sp. BN130291 TaxID=3112940 RepID=UPI002E25FF68|nr:DUF3617 domain-containing protein [Ideonella sp. BN130291]
MTFRLIVLTAALASATLASHAADPAKRKPGLWEVQSKTQGGGMPAGGMPDMNEAMKQMSPQQRAMVEQMMKDRGVGTGAKPNSFRYCLSKEKAEKDFVPQTDPDTDCTHKMDSTSATEAKFSFSCKRKDGSSVQGEGRAYNLTPESYAMDMRMKMQHDGKPMEMQMEQKGKWLGADCKGLKPLGG